MPKEQETKQGKAESMIKENGKWVSPRLKDESKQEDKPEYIKTCTSSSCPERTGGKCTSKTTPESDAELLEFAKGEFIRDACSVYPKPKSEMRTRLDNIIAQQDKLTRDSILEEIEEKILKRFKCGRCEDTRIANHSLWCIAIKEVKNIINK